MDLFKFLDDKYFRSEGVPIFRVNLIIQITGIEKKEYYNPREKMSLGIGGEMHRLLLLLLLLFTQYCSRYRYNIDQSF